MPIEGKATYLHRKKVTKYQTTIIFHQNWFIARFASVVSQTEKKIMKHPAH